MTPDDDVWYSFVAPGPNLTLAATYDNGATDVYWQVFSGACGSSMTSVLCTDANAGATLTGLTTNATYYLRMYTSGTGAVTQQDLCLKTPPGPPPNDECAGAVALTINANGTCTSETSGTVENALGSVQPNDCYGNDNDDVWYYFTANSTQHVLGLNSMGNSSDMVYSVFSSGGSCATLSATNIECNEIYYSASGYSNVPGLTIGNRYYVRVYSYSGTAQTSTFDICLQAPLQCPANLGAGNVTVPSLPYSATGETTVGAGNEITGSNVVSCGSSYYFDGLDKVYIFTPTTSGSVTINMTSTEGYTGITVFEGCPFSGSCLAYQQNYQTGLKKVCINVTAGVSYYLVVDTDAYSNSSIASFDLTISAPSTGAANDLPCNAVTMVNGGTYTGDNNCTSGTSEPAVPGCWTTGNVNTLWYKFVATSTNMYLQTALTTIASTQIAVYSGTVCSSLTYVACNQDAGSTGCAGSSQQNSLLDLTTLSIGATYWVRVDGQSGHMGIFNISLNDGTSVTTNDPVLGQDCSFPIPVCTNVMNVPNPSFSGTGNICDFTTTNNCTSGEVNSVWYTFTIGVNGNLNFIIMPNDGSNTSNGSETDYDWVLWKTSGAGATFNCSTLNSGTPTACNFGSPGVTGMSPDGNAPVPIDAYFNSVFETSVPVVAGEEYVLVVQNYVSSSSGFNLDFSTSSAGVIDFTPNTIYWGGITNTNFSTSTNWGLCGTVPSCAVNTVINAATNQPLITGTMYTRDLTINAGATLTMAASSTLEICGNLTNNGTIICPASSTIKFVDGSNTTQTINGNLSGNSTLNKFGNLTVFKAAGSVIMNTNVNVGGTFLTSNATSIYNINGRYMKVAGNFYNNDGDNTFTGTGTASTVEFNGIGSQNYNQGSSDLNLNFVKINNTGGTINAVQLQTDMNIKPTTGSLTLTLGTITTTGTSTTTGYKVFVKNTTPACVSVGNASSFVLGNLRRNVTTAGDYNWPVGNAAMGYERAQTIFSVTAGMTYIDSRFDVWPMTCTQAGTECGVTWDQPTQNNGFWTMIPDAGTCTYDCTLYSLGATNSSGMSAWTIIKREHTSAIANDLWLLNGTCAASTATVVTRTGMTNFSFLGVDQALTPLPIELTSFTGENNDVYNVLKWTTAS